MRKRLAAMFAVTAFLFFSTPVFSVETPVAKPVHFVTKDGVVIHGLLLETEKPKAFVILLPMLSKTKGSWEKTQGYLKENGYSTLAIDLRGHGESNQKNGREISWRTFSQKDFKKMTLDVDAAFNFARGRKIEPKKIFVLGASIGANTALNFAVEKPDLGGVLLLSPGLDYRGVETVPGARAYNERPIFYAASTEDLNSIEATRHLAAITPNREIVELEMAGHGTDMIQNSPPLLDSIVAWLDKQVGFVKPEETEAPAAASPVPVSQ